ncbi:DUF4365 domain-containing protein [Paenibacillus sedimenti]|uniref:DUF4365 domain-containing protein n=1 Tax=Paenibacillus sedimenti TaxID=2770274 RepID=A0A926KUQ2_9BACL|nr:DUF4365 domain-containing protein [Paenibacillus sedimenti]MBD0383887.1 DUF4365 domain-containing protein [Paenibacillus sedimenti]
MYDHLPATHPLNNFRDIESVGFALYLLGKHRRAIAQTATVDKWPNTDGIIDLLSINGELIGKFDIQIKKLPDDHNMVFDLPVKYLSYCLKVASEPTITLMVDTINEKIYWFHVTKEWIQASNYSENKETVRIPLSDDRCLDRSNISYLTHWEEIAKENRRHKNMLQQLLDAEKGNTFLRMNLLDESYSPILSNIKMSVITRQENEDGSFTFIMANTYEFEETVFLQVNAHLSPDLVPTLSLNMSPMSKENAFHNMIYFKCLAQLRTSGRFYLADNHSDFWAEGAVQFEEPIEHIENSIKFYKTVVDLERRINEKLPLSQSELTPNELRCVEQLVSATQSGFVLAALTGIKLPYPSNEIDMNEALRIKSQIINAEGHWGINLGNKILASSKPFIIIKEEEDGTLIQPDPSGKFAIIFEQFYLGEFSDVFKRINTNDSSDVDTQ